MNAPLAGFDLPSIPADRLPGLADALDTLAWLQRRKWPEFARKCRDRADALRAEWRRRVGRVQTDGTSTRPRPTTGRAAP